MRTAAEPRAAWAEWAGWTCKERQRSLRPDAQRLDREDRRPPSGNRRGSFHWRRCFESPEAPDSRCPRLRFRYAQAPSRFTTLENNNETLDDALALLTVAPIGVAKECVAPTQPPLATLTIQNKTSGSILPVTFSNPKKLHFPFDVLASPRFGLDLESGLAQVTGYVSSWSARSGSGPDRLLIAR
jgi:hypothetical protein